MILKSKETINRPSRYAQVLALFITLSSLNVFKYGITLSGVLIPIVLFTLIFINIIGKKFTRL